MRIDFWRRLDRNLDRHFDEAQRRGVEIDSHHHQNDKQRIDCDRPDVGHGEPLPPVRLRERAAERTPKASDREAAPVRG